MRCRSCRKELPAWLDGELAPRRAEQVHLHLQSCTACAAERDRLQAVLRVVDDLPVPEPSDDFRAGFEARLQKARLARAAEPSPARAPGWAFWRLPALGGAGAAVLAAVLVGVLLRGGHGPAPVGAGELEMARHLDLLRDYEVVSNLDALENFEVVQSLDTLLEDAP